jgi:hypothetical protein
MIKLGQPNNASRPWRLKRSNSVCLPRFEDRTASYPKWRISVRGVWDLFRSAPGDPRKVQRMGQACPQLAQADVRAFGRDSGYDPNRKSDGRSTPKGLCEAPDTRLTDHCEFDMLHRRLSRCSPLPTRWWWMQHSERGRMRPAIGARAG